MESALANCCGAFLECLKCTRSHQEYIQVQFWINHNNRAFSWNVGIAHN